MFKNMKLSVKLITGFLCVAAVTAIVGAVGVYGLGILHAHINEIGHKMIADALIGPVAKSAQAWRAKHLASAQGT